MNAKLGQHLTLLGLCVMAFYGAMLASGQFSLEVMPQFLISAVIFLSSGRLLKRGARVQVRQIETPEKPKARRREPDWAWLSLLLNWMGALLILGLLAIFLMKPAGVSFSSALQQSKGSAPFFSGAVP